MHAKFAASFFLILAVSLAAGATSDEVARPLARVTFHVVDEDYLPIAGARLRIGFQEQLARKQKMLTGETDAAGGFIGEGYVGQRLSSDVSKQGFYDSAPDWIIFRDQKDGKWLPWDMQTQIIMRRLASPVALFAKQVRVEVPVLDRPCGYDLEKGDWVVPFGKGTNPDLVFTVHRDYKDRFNFAVEGRLGFSHPLDGLLPMSAPSFARASAFLWERLAPTDGYTAPHIMWFRNHDPRDGLAPEISFDLTDRYRGYFFRIRTVEQNGQIIAANYGKITGDIVIDPRESNTCFISFTYYFNPKSLERNLEWDPKRNLLQGVSPDQTPRGS
jgi:hypothetical protein